MRVESVHNSEYSMLISELCLISSDYRSLIPQLPLQKQE